MSKTKKAISLLLSMVIVLSIFAPSFTVFALPKKSVTIAEFSRLGAPSTYSARLGAGDVTKASKIYSYNGRSYYTEGADVYKTIRDKAEKRISEFTLRMAFSSVQTTNSLGNTLLNCIMNASSDQMSRSSTDGDYIYWHMAASAFVPEYMGQSNGKYCYKLDLTLLYRDTASQEKKVDSVVNGFLNDFKTSGKSDYEIIKGVHDFICKKATYDYEAIESASGYTSDYDYAFTSYGALVKGKTVCQGYALAFYRLCKELGYKCRFVSSDPEEGCHAWNIVELNGKYYFVDCTWDDESDNYDLFLVDYDGIRKDDRNYSGILNIKQLGYKQHTLDASIYSDYDFVERYQNYFAKDDYDSTDSSLITNCKVKLGYTSYVYDGDSKTPSANAYDFDGEKLSSSSYSVSYHGNTNPGMATVRLNGKGDYAGSKTHRMFKIRPSKISGFKILTGKSTNNSLTLKWSEGDSVSGYYIYRYTPDGWKYIKDITSSSTTSYKVTGLSPASSYRFKILAYKKVNNRKIYSSAYPTARSTTLPKAPSLSLSTKSKSIKAKWGKVKATGYQLEYSTSKNMSGKKTIKLGKSTTSKTIKSLKKGKRYYVRVRAIYKKTYSDGTTSTYSSKWSAKKSIIVK